MKKILAFLSVGALVACLNYVSVSDNRSTDESPWSDLTNSKAEKYAIKAYYKAKENNQTSSNIVTFVDFTKPSTAKRLWVIDVSKHKIVFNTYVTHGTNSGKGVYATSFSNKSGSLQSSIGVYKTGYVYTGKHGKSLKLHGLEYTNNNAFSRAVVVHPASYIGNGKTGHSWGCFGLPTDVSSSIINSIKDGSILVAYYPDSSWISNSKYLN